MIIVGIFFVYLSDVFSNTIVDIHVYIGIYIYMDALVSRYLTSLLMGSSFPIGRSIHRVVVGGARVGEGGDGEGGGRGEVA